MDGKKINVGLNLFRILLTFGVVLDHFWLRRNPGSLVGIERAMWHWRTLAVPAFMTMTFFLTARHFRDVDLPWLKRRFVRLYEPFVFWALVYWAVKSAMMRFNPDYATSFSDLLWQLALGSSRTLTMQFWFHADLIILTAVAFLAFRFFRSARAYIYLSLAAIAIGFTVQYTSLNAAMFGKMSFETKYPLGRLFSMAPYAGAGILLAAAKGWIDRAAPGVKVAVSLFGLWVAWLAIYCPLCPRPPAVAGYEGLVLNCIAWGLLPAFYWLPFDRAPAAVTKAVLFVSRYAMGVYCVHLLLGWIFYDYVLGLEKVSFPFGTCRSFTVLQCLAVWALSYVFCWLVSLIPAKFFRRVVE